MYWAIYIVGLSWYFSCFCSIVYQISEIVCTSLHSANGYVDVRTGPRNKWRFVVTNIVVHALLLVGGALYFVDINILWLQILVRGMTVLLVAAIASGIVIFLIYYSYQLSRLLKKQWVRQASSPGMLERHVHLALNEDHTDEGTDAENCSVYGDHGTFMSDGSTCGDLDSCEEENNTPNARSILGIFPSRSSSSSHPVDMGYSHVRTTSISSTASSPRTPTLESVSISQEERNQVFRLLTIASVFLGVTYTLHFVLSAVFLSIHTLPFILRAVMWLIFEIIPCMAILCFMSMRSKVDKVSSVLLMMKHGTLA